MRSTILDHAVGTDSVGAIKVMKVISSQAVQVVMSIPLRGPGVVNHRKGLKPGLARGRGRINKFGKIYQNIYEIYTKYTI